MCFPPTSVPPTVTAMQSNGSAQYRIGNLEPTYSEGVTTLGHAAGSDLIEHDKQQNAAGLSSDDLQCPICVEQLQDAFVTTCGHTFCYSCIMTHLRHRRNCPCCASYLTAEHIYPNFLLNKILGKVSTYNPAPDSRSFLKTIEQALESSKPTMRHKDLDAAIQLLQDRREQLVQQEETSSLHLLLLLLKDAKHKKASARSQLSEQLSILEKDIRSLAAKAAQMSAAHITANGDNATNGTINGTGMGTLAAVNGTHDASNGGHNATHQSVQSPGQRLDTTAARQHDSTVTGSILGPRVAHQAFGDASAPPSKRLASLRAAKKRLMLSQYDDLQQCYLSMRGKKGNSSDDEQTVDHQHGTARQEHTNGVVSNQQETEGAIGAVGPGLSQFCQVFNAATTFTRFKAVAEVPKAALGGPISSVARNAPRSNPGRPSSVNLVSSIDFNSDNSMFATCSSQRVFLWNYGTVLGTTGAQQAAVGQISSRTKLTGLAYSRHQQDLLAASDSEGQVCLYSTTTLQMVMDVSAHDGRIWALDFVPNDSRNGQQAAQPHCFATGGDDYTTRVWDVRASKACSTIDTRANVCSVRYCPWDSNYLAVGSAAHAVLLYDLRRAGGTAAPLANLSGHSKAVSYVRWASATELVSASTDNTLRLWSVKGWISPNESHAMGAASPCLRTYSGHVNERNFVGLSVQNDLIAAGSETNEVVVYHKHMPSPSIRHRLVSSETDTSQGASAAHQHFTSAHTWHPSDGSLVVASSQGTLWVLSLQQDLP